MLRRLARQGGLDGAQLRDRARRQARLPVPARSRVAARHIGWDREHVGSHIVRRNTIHDCGQTGIVGHLGCVFSTIEDNHIYNIALKREFYGYEIGGIKLHAAIDVVIRHNRIHDCSLGTWLDWQTQGTRISRNLFYGNKRDLFVEVSHGPYAVDHNVFASPASLELFSQGGAFVNNLVCGTVSIVPVVERPTPYHVPHSTQVAGYAAILEATTANRERLPRWRRRPGLRAERTRGDGDRLRDRRVRRAPDVDHRVHGPGRQALSRRPRTVHGRQATRLHPRERLRHGRQPVRGERDRSSSTTPT